MRFEIPNPEGSEEQASSERADVLNETHSRLNFLRVNIFLEPEGFEREVMRKLHGDHETRIDLARLNRIREVPKAVEILGKDKDYRVRETFARNGWLFIYPENAETAVRLIHDENESVRFAMARHVHYTPIYAKEFAHQYETETSQRIKKLIREHVLRRATIQRRFLEVFRPDFTSQDPLTRIRASKNLSLVRAYPEEAKKLFKDKDVSVRLAIANGGLVKLFPEEAEELAHDPNKNVREAYLTNQSRTH